MARCLIIDNNEINRMAAASMVEMLGFESITSNGAMDALEPITEGAVSVILLDWMMPDISGKDLLELIRESRFGKKIPIIVCSGTDNDQAIYDAVENGDIEGYIRKPITIEQLRSEFAKANLI